MDKIDIIKLCAIIIAICVLLNTSIGIYYDLKYTIRNHDKREIICDTGENLIYIESLQTHKEKVTCCELQKEHGVDHIVYCEDILIKET